MKAYETSATVEEQRQIHVAGLPFPPGTEVEIVIRAKAEHQPGLRWEGNVLVHEGIGEATGTTEAREQHLDRLAQGGPA